MDPILFRQQDIWGQKNFWMQNFFRPKIFSDPKFFSEQTFFRTQKKFLKSFQAEHFRLESCDILYCFINILVTVCCTEPMLYIQNEHEDIPFQAIQETFL